MPRVIYDYRVPDPSRPIPEDQRTRFGPTTELVSLVTQPVTLDAVKDRKIDAMSLHVGTHTMGSPAFFGLRLGHQWLVVAVWGAAAWMVAEDRMVEDFFYSENDRQKPWVHEDDDDLSPHVVGHEITELKVEAHALRITLSSGMTIAIQESPDTRPIYQGSGKPRELATDDDLRRAVFLSPTDEIWV